MVRYKRCSLFCTALFLFLPQLSWAAEGEGLIASYDRQMLTLFKPVLDLFAGNGWLQGATVILLTFVLASSVTGLVFSLIKKVLARSQDSFYEQISSLIRPPVYYSLLMSGILAGLNFMPHGDRFLELSGRSLRTLGLIVWIYFIVRLVPILLKRMVYVAGNHSLVQGRTLTLFDNGAKVVVFGGAAYCFFVIWHIDLTAWIASAGIAGIAIGFAAKDTLSNLFSGVFILADTPYRVGDYIVLDGGGRGKVLQIGLRSTRILTRDDVEVIIPNAVIGNSAVTNQSGGPSGKLRVKVKIGVAYGCDIDQVKQVLLDIATAEPGVPADPAPRVRFRAFGASSLDLELLCWVDDPELRGRVLDSLNTDVYKTFNALGIEIPYAKQDVYIKSWPLGLQPPLEGAPEK
ncbi:mechanosensitive ion channel family protein [Desulfotalea psychrophila]|uniref:Hypothetical membrane protein n=1 Tax=Desulfotalea psychrophila (strain LSv54 / DSM 12343) TaxID=177439 RepID=Q6AIY9_DESPS|nr:mechanosensitive ion channel family protein [Desulfotalea psychrophila]CAG37691.1 hypothetical membrane protein [Desulfotalea psychrophila LSv54]